MAVISCAQKLSVTGMNRYHYNQIKVVEGRCGQNDSAPRVAGSSCIVSSAPEAEFAPIV